ncbi:hypothetical protein HMPREF1624_05052 [Sporothrix schenckii ATCC 58251]|uniref:Alpha N-terminal protein methyltransferase 1 n=1 Tax=Sporothrix schenckii (strain ATCC 58251 / de Perez 2211183) TaxID=1391915 RepID=U7PU31_SPOS1|nr:hypothetical protein HMPREF1624_05052 [Sporothrix schenckii ATCC 58251]
MADEHAPPPPGTSSEDAPEARVNNADAKRYWESISADDHGMLGGFAFVSRADLRGSRTFLAKLGIGRTGGRGLRRVARALEGGAGIGRVTEGLLLDVADEVDVIEPVAKFTAALAGKPGVRRIFNTGLEGWAPEADSVDGGAAPGLPVYDLVWTQWCTGYLNDDQFVAYLRRCRTVLAPGTGLVVVKENLTTTGVDDFDAQDSSVTRSETSFQTIFAKAGFRLVRSELQRGFPPEAELLPVKMYALKAIEKAEGAQETR